LSTESTLAKIIKETDLTRRTLISSIQDHLSKDRGFRWRVLSYMARTDVPGGQIIQTDAVLFREALKQLQNPPNLALVLNSPGGIIEAAEKIGLMIRENVKELIVIIPDMAKSAATMLALLANQIFMSDLSEMGPIDPQILVGQDPNTGGPVFRPAWAIINAPFHLHDLLKGGKVDPNIIVVMARSFDTTLIDAAQNALDLSTTIAEGWMTKHMGLQPDEAKKIADTLGDASQFLSHGRSIRYPDAQKLGLKVAKMDPVLDEMTFELYLRSLRVLRDRRMKIVDWDSGGLAADA
jgi:hypothetical protein